MSQPVQGVDRQGFAAAAAAFTAWGLVPLYWYLLRDVPAPQIIAHRVVWSALLVVAWLQWREGSGWLRTALATSRNAWMLATSAMLVSINWGIYIWAVTHGHVVESSLGYFITPLFNVILGVVFLRERLNRPQWLSVAVATIGVCYLTWSYGQLPWIALVLGSSFSLYGYVRKIAAVEAVVGLGVENVLLMPLAMIFLLWVEWQGHGSFGHLSTSSSLLLIVGGAVTALPLVGFAYGARKLPYSVVGLLQYIAPTLQLLCGVMVFHEPFTQQRLTGFAFIWLALLIYAGDGLWRTRRSIVIAEA